MLKVRVNHPFFVTSHGLLRDPLSIYEITPLPLTIAIHNNLLSLILNLSHYAGAKCEVLGR